ncbi:MAG TPA: alpha-1,4-glucan--maltose-1-phosphate maltosyltransferase [Thermoleophilaceae bacterium]
MKRAEADSAERPAAGGAERPAKGGAERPAAGGAEPRADRPAAARPAATGPGAPPGAADAAGQELRDERIRDDAGPEHPLEAPGEDWSALPRPSERTAPARIQVLNPEPMVDCGRFPAKRTVGDAVTVSADIFRDGHEILRAVIRYRGPGETDWREAPMHWTDREVDGDRWAGYFMVTETGRWEFTVEAWSDLFATWRDELRRKIEGGQHDLRGELSEGVVLLEDSRDRADGEDRRLIEHVLATIADPKAPEEAKHDAALGPELLAALERNPDRHDATRMAGVLETDVERERARFGSWYELFPRSWGGFEGVRRRLPELAELGFDVLYLPPIHPIGRTNRKGRNNALEAGPDDPGSPWAIGSEEGGHEAVHPELGTVDDFVRLTAEARELGIDIALDFAIQCSADHPWLTEHPEWFNRRPDGTLKYAENPPKRYQDIYNVNFDCEDWKGLWDALRDVVMLWVERGVRAFRVDNPHTKPLPFWEWLIREVRAEHPDVIFLSEAFTRRVKLRALAKAGFSQSYTYFTWKNWSWELREYVEELAHSGMQEYCRPNFFANTPDILNEYLVHGGPAAFETRLVLAATLSPSYGIYSGFESFENVPVREGSEEYLDSEKYEIKKRSLDGPLLPMVARINRIRRENVALQHLWNITFLDTENDELIAYHKRWGDNTIIVVASVDPHRAQEGVAVMPAWLGLPPVFAVEDLLDAERYDWRIGRNYVRLGPGERMAHVFRAIL